MTGALAHYLGTDRKGVRIFLTISLSACVYWFLSIKTVVYEPFRQALDVTNTQLGVLLSITGFVQVFGYVALGWLQDSLQIRKVIAVDLVAYALLALTLAVLPDLPFWWLCCVFAGFGLFGEALYWPTIQKATRGLSGPAHQAALFSTQEALRGAMGLAANFVTLTLFLAGGSRIIGVRAAMACYPLIMIVLAIIVLRNTPADFLRTSGGDAQRPTAGEGLRSVAAAVRSPIVWTTGMAAMTCYVVYIAATTYALPLFQDTYGMPSQLVAVLGMVNTGVFPVVSALASGLVARRFPTSPCWMAALFVIATFLGVVIMVMPAGGSPVPVIVVTALLALSCYGIRAVYFVPIGEYGTDPRHSATVMSVASFLGYLPSFFAYPLFGAIIDASGGGIAAQRTVFALVVASCAAEAVFSLASHRLIVRRRWDTGWPAPIAVDVS